MTPALAPLATGQLVDRLEGAFQAFWSDPARHQAGRQDLARTRFDLVSSVFAELRDRAPGLTPQTAQVFADRFHAEREAGARLFPGAL